jgi:hypothetical protein
MFWIVVGVPAWLLVLTVVVSWFYGASERRMSL